MNNKDLSEKALKYIHWIVGFVIFCFVLSIWGCSAKEKVVTVYKDVKIPTKCSIEMPVKPEPALNPVEMNFLILRYTEELEAALRSCK